MNDKLIYSLIIVLEVTGPIQRVVNWTAVTHVLKFICSLRENVWLHCSALSAVYVLKKLYLDVSIPNPQMQTISFSTSIQEQKMNSRSEYLYWSTSWLVATKSLDWATFSNCPPKTTLAIVEYLRFAQSKVIARRPGAIHNLEPEIRNQSTSHQWAYSTWIGRHGWTPTTI
jgi:hypothetical protein